MLSVYININIWSISQEHKKHSYECKININNKILMKTMLCIQDYESFKQSTR